MKYRTCRPNYPNLFRKLSVSPSSSVRQCHILHPLLLLLLLLFSSPHNSNSSRPPSSSFSPTITSRDPYEILGVSRQATQEEIKKKYRSLCLKYHPDKNVLGTEEEKKRSEEAFKLVQLANSQIGDVESRRKYDHSFDISNSFRSNPYGSSAAAPFDRNFNGYEYPPFRFGPTFPSNYYTAPLRRSFFVNGMDISHLFDSFHMASQPSSPYHYHPHKPQDRTDLHQDVTTNNPKAVYIQRVTIPLEELYKGVKGKQFVVKDSIFQRYQAAFRGGIAKYNAFQGLFTSLPLLLRTRWPVTFLFFLITFHFSLPRPNQLHYTVDINQGWRGGTKIKFASVDPGVDIIFVLEEGKHERFQRVGDNLHVTYYIGVSKTKTGGKIYIVPLLENDELPILIHLKPNEIQRSGQVITVHGRGWPKRKNSTSSDRDSGFQRRGDLLVTFIVISDQKAQNRQKKRSTFS